MGGGTTEFALSEAGRCLAENQSTYTPIGESQRWSNPGKVELRMVKVQSGANIGEDDINQFEDFHKPHDLAIRQLSCEK